ncbi:MAG: GumC family protein [Bryobacteraceae bacterium]
MKDDFDSQDSDAKRLSFRTYINMVWRCRWYIALPTFLLGLAGFVAARHWPYLYRSEALVLVEQQKIPENYVSSNVVISLEQRLDQMTQQVLSRTQLRRLIEQFNLYPKELARKPMDDVLDHMRSAAKVELVAGAGKAGTLTAFRVSFLYSEPHLAQRVTNELTSLIIDENLKSRTQQSIGATNFFETELDRARQDLAGQEERLREYKMRYIGELPEQLNSNLQMLDSLQNQLRATNGTIDRAEQQKVYLETLRTEYRSLELPPALGGTNTRTPADPAIAARAKTMQDLQQKLNDLETMYTPEHPDVKKLKAQIAALEATPLGKTEGHLEVPPAVAAAAPNRAYEAALLETESRLKAIKLEIETNKRETAALKKQIAATQEHVGLTPVREQQLAEVTRNYQNSRANYQSMLEKKRQSELATDLEKRQEGERLRVLDPASLPKTPDMPTPLEVITAGWAAGICLGLALAILREATNQRIRSEDDITQLGKLPNLCCFPNVLSPHERRSTVWKRVLEVASVLFLAGISIAAGLRTYWKL